MGTLPTDVSFDAFFVIFFSVEYGHLQISYSAMENNGSTLFSLCGSWKILSVTSRETSKKIRYSSLKNVSRELSYVTPSRYITANWHQWNTRAVLRPSNIKEKPFTKKTSIRKCIWQICERAIAFRLIFKFKGFRRMNFSENCETNQIDHSSIKFWQIEYTLFALEPSEYFDTYHRVHNVVFT